MGYIKLDHALKDWQYYGVQPMTSVWVDILLNASYKDNFVYGILLKKGQCLVGRSSGGQRLGITESVYRGCIKRLKLANQITTEKTNKGTVITVINWEKYQSSEVGDNQPINQQIDQALTNHSPTDDQPMTNHSPSTNHKEELKELKEVKEVKNKDLKENIKRKFGEFKNVLLTDEEYEKLLNQNLDYMIEKLSCYLESTGKKYKSHYATILNWSRKESNKKKESDPF